MKKVEIGIDYIIDCMEENESDIIVIKNDKEKIINAKQLLYEFDIEEVKNIYYIEKNGDIKVVLNNGKILIKML